MRFYLSICNYGGIRKWEISKTEALEEIWVLEKCTRQLVLTVETNVKYRSNLQKVNQFIVETASVKEEASSLRAKNG